MAEPIRGCVAAALADAGYLYGQLPDDEWEQVAADMEAAYQQAVKQGRWKAGDPPDAIVDVWYERHQGAAHG